MKTRFEQGLLKHLATVAIAFGTGVAPADGLQEIPVRVLGEIVDGIEQSEWDRRDRQRLLGLLACDDRAQVRARVAEKAVVLWADAPDQSEQLLRRFAHDASPAVRRATVTALARVLQEAHPLERIALVAGWSTSDSRAERAAMAAALRGLTPVFIGDLAIEQLAMDADSAVRRFAIEAAAQHFHESPTTYARVAMGAASDRARRVRRAARRLLERELLG